MRIVFKAKAICFVLRRADPEYLAGGDVHVGRQDVAADEGVDEGAFTALRLADDEHLVGIVRKPFGKASQPGGGVRQPKCLGCFGERIQDRQGLLANRLGAIQNCVCLGHGFRS